MAAYDDKSRPSEDSLSSVSTTSLVFDRIQEESEKVSAKGNKRSQHGAYTDLDDQDPLNDEDPSELETGPFLRPGAALHRQPMDRVLRRILFIIGGVFIAGWFVALAIFLASGSYRHASDAEHDPDADGRGSGKAVTMDQVFTGYFSPRSHSIAWIAGPDGEDGLLLEQGATGKDYLYVQDVRSAGDDEGDFSGTGDKFDKGHTLMTNATFDYGGESLESRWVQPSPDLTKVLVGVNLEHNWRHSFTGVYYVLDVESQHVEPLDPKDPDGRVQLAGWSPRSDAVSFTRQNNLFVRHLTDTKDVTQVTDDGGAEYFYGIPDWVYEEEVLGSGSATWWSEDGKYLAFFRTNETGVPDFQLQYYASRPSGKDPADGEGSYPELRKVRYPKAGAHNPVVDLQFYDVSKGDVFTVDVEGGFEDDDRIINNILWAGDKVLVKETNRVSDVLRVIHVDVGTREGKTINTIDVDKIDGGWFEISHEMTYVPADASAGRPHDGYVDTIIYEGYDHLAYFTPLDNPDPVILTSGKWEVEGAPSAVDLAKGLVYFSSTKESPIQRHIYSVKLDGSDLTPLTDTAAEGYYGASFSSGAGYALLSYQGPKVPYQKVISTPSHSAPYTRLIEDNAQLSERARTHNLPIIKYGSLSLDNGVTVNYKERRPPHFDSNKKYPVLFQQYSGPGSQSVTKRFSVDFHSYIASSLDYIVITVDPRGTGFMGRAHRVPVRSHLGVLEADDHIAAAKHFASLPYIDASRLAIWGWSYGGFQTLKTLERDAGQTYSYGMAVAPVTDWRFYDSIYTERYMRTPQDNADGYEASAVSNATALGGNVRFLMMHGTADDNVHFQNSLTLLDKLDLAGVENYDVHVFPDSNHNIGFHGANRIVYDKLNNWLINAFNGEWLKIANPKPNPEKRALLERQQASD